MQEKNEIKEVSEERQRKYWELSSFYNHVKCFEEHHPDAIIDEIINKFIDNQEFEAKAWRELAEYEEEMWRHNQRLLRAIRKIKGKTFYKYMLQIIKESDNITEKMQIVKEPNGIWNDEPFGKTIPGYWVDQWSVGTEGDSYEGFVYVKIKENKYLQLRYSM